MGRRPRVAAVSGVMRHEALTYGRAAAARPAGDGVGAAEEGRSGLTEGRLPARRLTERRSLRLPRRAECAFPSRRRSGGRGATPRQPAGHYGEWPNWANALEQPPRQAAGGVAPGSASLGLGPDCTERRSLGRGPR